MGRKLSINIGDKFGGLTFEKESGKDIHYNRLGIFGCDCGRKQEFQISLVKYGTYRACNICATETRKESQRRRRDSYSLINKKFNKVTVTKLLKDSDKHGNCLYECKCDCGNIITLTSGELKQHKSRSCGKCGVQAEIASKTMRTLHTREGFEDKIREGLILLENTSITILKRKHKPSNNSTGIIGVAFRKDRGIYFAQIMFQGKRYYLGSSKDKKEVEKLYLTAKEKLHNNFISWYEVNILTKQQEAKTIEE